MTSTVLHGLATRTEVRVEGARAPEVLDALRSAWSRCLAPTTVLADSSAVPVRLLEEGEQAQPGELSDDNVRRLMQMLTQKVTLSKIEATAGRLVMFHAGAVTHPGTGRAIAYVAPGGTGKTTLSRRLGQRYGYVTDETVAITPDGLVHPYPKPLSVLSPDGVKDEVSPDALGLLAVPEEVRLAGVVLLRRGGDVERPTFTPLDTITAITELCPETSALSALPRPLHLLADLLDALPPPVRVSYRDAQDIDDELVAMLEGR